MPTLSELDLLAKEVEAFFVTPTDNPKMREMIYQNLLLRILLLMCKNLWCIATK